MAIISRIKALGLPDGQFVVIGSGVMDALGLREATDIDLVVKPELFAQLKADRAWNVGERHRETVLTHDDVEVWLSWGTPDGQPNFEVLYDGGITIDDIRFASPEFVLDWKRAAHRPKDVEDVRLLEEYLA